MLLRMVIPRHSLDCAVLCVLFWTGHLRTEQLAVSHHLFGILKKQPEEGERGLLSVTVEKC